MSHEVHAAAKKSLFALFFQSGYSAVLGLAANIILTMMVDPQILGVYFSVLAVMGLFNYVSDVGLASAIIQKHEVTRADEKTVFTIQTVLIAALCTLGVLSTTFIQKWYGFPPNGVYLLWALFAGFFISSLKTLPSVLLERKLSFATVVKVQVIENTLFYICISLFALLGQGLMTFVYAVLVRAIVGCTLMYLFTGWRPAFGIDMTSVRELFSFGIPFQASSFLALFKDELVTLYLSKTLGFTGVGYIGWAKKWAEAPLRIIMDNVSKMIFPLLSRLQKDPVEMKHSLSRYLLLQTALLIPALVCISIAVPLAVQYLPKYTKWHPALPIFYMFVISAGLSSLSTPFMNIFNAVKKPHIPLFFMIFWTCATWIGVAPMTRAFGPIGFAYLQIALSCTVFVIIPIAKHQKLI